MNTNIQIQKYFVPIYSCTMANVVDVVRVCSSHLADTVPLYAGHLLPPNKET